MANLCCHVHNVHDTIKWPNIVTISWPFLNWYILINHLTKSIAKELTMNEMEEVNGGVAPVVVAVVLVTGLLWSSNAN